MYRDREEGFKDNFRRFAAHHKHMEKLGIVHEPDHPYHEIIGIHKLNLDNSALGMHAKFVLPTLEVVAS